jgi:hypothetical protein
MVKTGIGCRKAFIPDPLSPSLPPYLPPSLPPSLPTTLP